jgi:uncharacterized protein
VLFPRMLMPLQIFEERYKQMLDYCSANKAPFGIALIREGVEVGGPAEPFEIGTLAEILQVVDLEDGRKAVIVRGAGRFILRGLDASRPYLLGEIDELPFVARRFESRLLGYVELAFYRYLRLLKQAQGVSISIQNMPDDPEGIAWTVAWGLQLDAEVRQGLLTSATLQELLEQEHKHLKHENTMLQVLNAEETRRRRPPDDGSLFSLN